MSVPASRTGVIPNLDASFIDTFNPFWISFFVIFGNRDATRSIALSLKTPDGFFVFGYLSITPPGGSFVSEFMGYHGVWYRDLYEFDDSPCYLAGHVHVGGLIDWDTAREATEITISAVIESLDEYSYVPGDANNDENIDILDILTAIYHILGNQILEGPSFYAADMNSNGVINIQDIIIIINLIL